METSIIKNDAKYINILLNNVYQHSGFDFREYKPTTVIRRLQRRLYTAGVITESAKYFPFLSNGYNIESPSWEVVHARHSIAETGTALGILTVLF